MVRRHARSCDDSSASHRASERGGQRSRAAALASREKRGAGSAAPAVKTATYRGAVRVQTRWRSLANCNHGDATTSRFDSPIWGGSCAARAECLGLPLGWAGTSGQKPFISPLS
eukprot:COSAG01_NODE_1999_length_8688_cov_6.237280_10_plen_114_part_00